MKPKICVFDFDGTLTTRDTLLLFIRYARGEWAFWLGMLLFAPLLVLMKLHVLDNGKVKERVFGHFFRGMAEKDFNSWCERFAEHFAHILRPEGMKTVWQALADGHPVFVVSASIDRWVRPFFECRGCENGRGCEGTRVRGYENSNEAHNSNLAPPHPRTSAPTELPPHPRTPAPPMTIIGTQIEVCDGLLTGRFATPNCYGEEKVRRLRQLFPELSDYHMIAYGDSSGDRALLQMADEAHFKPFLSSF